MNYQETIEYIHNTPKFARELGNRMLRKLLYYLDNPQRNLRIIHIAGTNGKGSTAIMLAEILRVSGYKCGLFTSPYLERFNERIRINGNEIPDSKLSAIVTKIRTIIEERDAPVSEFALDTAAAFSWFCEEKCDIVVLETGMGGRLDATNVIEKPLVSVLSSIGMDHMQYLGDTLEKIAGEKCGIFKEGCPVVSYPLQSEEVFSVIRNFAQEKGCPLSISQTPQRTKTGINYMGKSYSVGLKGEFQAYNAATVLETISVLRKSGIDISESSVQEGLMIAKNNARFEMIGERMILDGGHNLPAAKALVSALKEKKKPVVFCVAMMEDKDWKGFLEEISSIAKDVIVTEIPIPRCCSADDMAKYLEMHEKNVFIQPDPYNAIDHAIEIAEEEDIICFCGSLYFAGHIRSYLMKKKNDNL